MTLRELHLMAEARMRAELLTTVLGSGQMDRRHAELAISSLDPLAEPSKPRSLRIEDVKAFFLHGRC